MNPSILRPYNVRGRYPAELNEQTVFFLARAFAEITGTKKIAVGRDARLSGPGLQNAVIEGLLDMGVDVVNLGLITTDELYFAAGAKNLDGLQISASHNPKDWNGLKFIKKGVAPLTDNELAALYKEAQKEERQKSASFGSKTELDVLPEYVEFLLKFIDPAAIKNFRVVVNPLNGTAGPIISTLTKKLPVEIIPLNMEPDGNFPKGDPDPFVPAMRTETAAVAKKNPIDFAASWDNDADRIIFFDENGEYAPGVFITAVLARYLLQKHPGGKIISDTRVVWPAKETVEAAGGRFLLNKPGHIFIKARMRQENALFAGEFSGHYYFKDFWRADNGFIPFLLMLEILSKTGKKLSEIIAPFRQHYFFSEEINFPLENQGKAAPLLEKIATHYRDGEIDRISGISIAYSDWRFNLRPSDNEPKLRLVVEARRKDLVEEKTDTLTRLIKKLL